MADLFYLSATVAFFGLMLGYTAFCARLGRVNETGIEPRP